MKHHGHELTAVDLPRLMRNHETLGAVIKQLKKETGWTSTAKVAKVSAMQFWDTYQIAVQNISAQVTGQEYDFHADFAVLEHRAAVEARDFARATELRWDIIRRLREARERQTYGDRWKILAKPDETVLVRLAPAVCKYVGPRGGEIRYNRDQRLPAAKFWPGGVIPEVKMVVSPPTPPVATWQGEHPLLVQLNEARQWERDYREEARALTAANMLLDEQRRERQKARDEIVMEIRDEAEELDADQDPEFQPDYRPNYQPECMMAA